MAWIDNYGDRDSDGFQEYKTRSSHGHYNQGWKDAGDAIVEADGTISPLPIATCELQGYVYDAKIRMADIYDVLERPEDATPAPARGEAPVRPVQRDVLVGGGGHVLPGPQRAQGADPERRLERRPPAPVRHRPARARRAGRSPADGAGHVVGLGRADAVVGPSVLQPVLVPDGLGLAARQRDDRGRVPPLRVRRRRPRRWRRASSTPPSGWRRCACPSSSRACHGSRRASRCRTSARTCRRRGRRAPCSGSSRSCAASTRPPTRTDRASTSIRRCRTGCRRSGSSNLRVGGGSLDIHFDGRVVDVLSNTRDTRSSTPRRRARWVPESVAPESAFVAQ